MSSKQLRTPLAILAFLSVACGGVSPPQAPIPPPVALDGAVGIRVTPPLGGVQVQVGPTQCSTDGAGIAFCMPVPIGDYTVVFGGIDAAIWQPYAPVTAHVDAAQTTEIVLALTPVRRPTPAIPFRGRLHVADRSFFDDQNRKWTWGFATEFLLLNDLLDGKDITPILDDPDRGLVALGANGVRVIGMAHYIPLNERGARDFTPANYGDRYFQALGELADLLRIRGLYLEFTALADAQLLMPAPRDQRAFIEKVAGVLSSKANAFLEHCNEPFKNGCGDELAMGRAPGAVLQASGNYDVRETADRWVLDTVLDYVTTHPPRDDEWARKAHDGQDIRDGFDNLGKHFDGARVPVVLDEPIGAADVAAGGRRASSPTLFREFGAAAAMFGAGATFHSDAGVATKPFSDIQRAAAAAFFSGLNAVAADAQSWRYSRGPFADMPIFHSDAWSLRTFGKLDGAAAYVVVVGPTDQWRLLEQGGYHCTALVDGAADVFRCAR